MLRLLLTSRISYSILDHLTNHRLPCTDWRHPRVQRYNILRPNHILLYLHTLLLLKLYLLLLDALVYFVQSFLIGFVVLLSVSFLFWLSYYGYITLHLWDWVVVLIHFWSLRGDLCAIVIKSVEITLAVDRFDSGAVPAGLKDGLHRLTSLKVAIRDRCADCVIIISLLLKLPVCRVLDLLQC